MVPFLDLVGTVGHRGLSESLWVLQRGHGDREVGVVAQAAREIAFRLDELNGEGAFIDDLEALHFFDAFPVALDGGEKALIELLVGHRVVPRIDEGIRGHSRAIGELQVRLERDLVGLLPFLVDGLGHFVVHVAVGVVVHQSGKQHVDDASAAVLIRHRGNEPLLRFGTEHANIV